MPILRKYSMGMRMTGFTDHQTSHYVSNYNIEELLYVMTFLDNYLLEFQEVLL